MTNNIKNFDTKTKTKKAMNKIIFSYKEKNDSH